MSTPETAPADAADRPRDAPRSGGSIPLRIALWLLAFGCFYYAWRNVEAAAVREGISGLEYLTRFFAEANWIAWLALMIPYSVFFFLVDSFAVSRVIQWFNAPVRWLDILPVRASTYIIAIMNEQVGKGAIALYLNRRNGVPGWEVGSSMVFVAFVELYQLLLFSSVGVTLYFGLVQEASQLLPLDRILPLVFVGAALYFAVHVLYFRGTLLPELRLRERPILRSFKHAKLWNYAALVAIKAPNLIMAVVVYRFALELFGVQVLFGELLAFLPVIFLAAALPLPFHAGALALWSVLFPEYPEVSAFSLVMHTAFVVFNGGIGLCFLPRVNRELFGSAAAPTPDPQSTPTS